MVFSKKLVVLPFYEFVVNSGFKVQATARAINGIDTNAVICKITTSCVYATSGIVISQGNGSEIMNQIPDNRPIISIFRFVFGFILFLHNSRI